jgi:hypothetical protein
LDAPQPEQEVHVIQTTGSTVAISFTSDTTVSTLKRNIEEMMSIPVRRQKLIFDSKLILIEGITLKRLGVQDQDIITLNTRNSDGKIF